MEEFANENNMLRLDIDGGQMYLPFAKRKLQEMKRLMSMRGITVDNRVIDVDEAEIFVQSIPGFDYIRITERPAKPGILLIFIRDTSLEPDGCDYQLVYDTSNGRNGKDYRALLYRLNDKGGDVELSPDGLMGDGLSVTDTGLTLNIQSGGGVYAAELPSIFVYNDMIDFAEFKLTAWGSILTLLNQQRVVGSRYISAWTKAQVGTAYKYAEDASQFMRMSSSRHAYTSGSDGYINACMFKNQQSLLGTGVMYRELSLTPEDSFYQLWKNEIAYKTTPDDTGYISGKLVGSDYITGTPWQTGYNWETYQVIDIFDKDNALVKVVSNLITKGGNQLLPYTINLTVRSRWYIEIPPTFFTTEDTWVYNGQTAVLDTTCVRTERLMVGDLEIESTQYEEYRY
ncbi:MAG: hypothetical protein L7F77_04940, partial [Candidatus Magnetominusculus sp. LBB02]|nr:hypothetical protein [Candidatus Magnetominusculus sp. LBB02]